MNNYSYRLPNFGQSGHGSKSFSASYIKPAFPSSRRTIILILRISEGSKAMRYVKNVLKFISALFESPISAGILPFIVYAIIAAQRGSITGASNSPYFNYLADAFLHGQFSLQLLPVNHHDLAFFNGQHFMYWPPFPAILLMPFIALFGVIQRRILYPHNRCPKRNSGSLYFPYR